MTDEPSSWLTFTIRDTDAGGVDVPKLSRFLERISTAFYAIARTKIGGDVARPGPRTSEEEALAGIRVLRVEPGSAIIELTPPQQGLQAAVPIDGQLTADDVALDFFREVERIESRQSPPQGWSEIRRRVHEVVDAAGEIGREAEIAFRPLVPRPGTEPLLRTTLRTSDLQEESRPAQILRRRRISGHAYMVDVEPGRQRVRIKMPDGRDTTMAVDEKLLPTIHDLLDRVVEVEVEEAVDDSAITSRTIYAISVLPSSGPGSDVPPRSVEELAEEQGLPKERPDYQSLASEVWTSEKEVEDFQRHLAEIRRAEVA